MFKFWQIIITLIVIGAGPASSAPDLEVSVRTIDCSGNQGFATFSARDLHKVQTGDCTDPQTGQKLQQVLLKSQSGLVQYEVLWITQEEAGNLWRQLKGRPNAFPEPPPPPQMIIQHEEVIRNQQPAIPVVSQYVDLPGPVITIVDPPIANTRSITNIITPTSRRTVVGKVVTSARLVSLTINGQSQSVDEHGMFKSDVTVTGSRAPVTIVAVDNQGKRSSVEFRLLPAPPPEPTAASAADVEHDVFGKYHALIIANNEYNTLDDLSTPQNDADVIEQILTDRYGFKVTRLYNGTRYQILSALNKLRRELTEQDNLLLYYAGHGDYDKINNRGHWLPVDAESNSTANWISTIGITDIINQMSAKHVLVIADSCYSGALTRATNTQLDPGMTEEARSKWLRIIAKTRSRFVLTSGGVKPVLDDSGNGHSMFANAFIEVLDKNRGVLEGSTLFREIKSRVVQRAEELNVEQSPQYAQLKQTGHEFGEFLLRGQGLSGH